MEKIRKISEVRDNNNDYSISKIIILIIIGISLGFGLSQFYKNKFYYLNQLNNPINNNVDNFNFAEDIHETDDMTVANKLKKEIKVLCWIMTQPKNHLTRAQYISKTWGKRCNKLLIISSTEDKNLNIIGLPVKDNIDNLWNKTIEAYKYIYKNHIHEFDWFLRADDDTYVIVENLRYLLYAYDSTLPIFFGHKYEEEDFMYSGAGYVLSKTALKQFITEALPDPEKCPIKNGIADVEFGKCLYNVGVFAVDSHDSKNYSRFYSRPEDLVHGKPDPKIGYWSRMYYETFLDKNFGSDYPVSFHGIIGKQMYVLEFLIYHLRPYGIERKQEPLPEERFYVAKQNLIN